MYIFLLAGQSNMVGQGIMTPEDEQSYPNIYSLDQDSNWVIAKNPLQVGGRVSLGISFAKELSEKYGENIRIGLVPCAVGGTSIENWLNDTSQAGVHVYSNFISRAKFAAKEGIVSGLLWHQGESDAHDAFSFSNYYPRLLELLLRIRTDLGNDKLPVITGELGDFLDPVTYGSYPDSINKCLHDLQNELDSYDVVSSEGLTDIGDHLHFNSGSLRTLGKRYAKAWFNMSFNLIGVNLGIDRMVVGGHSIIVKAGDAFDSYLWSTGDTTSSITIDSSGVGYGEKKIYVNVVKNYWIGSDTLNILFLDPFSLCDKPTCDLAFQLYPCPNKGTFFIEFGNIEDTYELSVFNLLGKKVYQETIKNIDSFFIKEINLSTLTSGSYLIEISTEYSKGTRFFIIH